MNMKTIVTVSLCAVELNLMVLKAKKQCLQLDSKADNFETFECNLMEELRVLGFIVGSRHMPLSSTMKESLDCIRSLNSLAYECFEYAYNGSLQANPAPTD